MLTDDNGMLQCVQQQLQTAPGDSSSFLLNSAAYDEHPSTEEGIELLRGTLLQKHWSVWPE